MVILIGGYYTYLNLSNHNQIFKAKGEEKGTETDIAKVLQLCV